MDLLTVLYTISGLIFGLAFLPQIMTLLKDTTHAASLNLSTWSMFSSCNAIQVAYAVQNNGDPYLVICASICMLGNISVLGLGIWRKTQGKLELVRA